MSAYPVLFPLVYQFRSGYLDCKSPHFLQMNIVLHLESLATSMTTDFEMNALMLADNFNSQFLSFQIMLE